LNNYAAGLKAWHLLHGRPWKIHPAELKAILDGAAALAPMSSKRTKRAPFTPSIILAIKEHLDLNNHKDAAIFACITMTFYSVARLGEFTVSALKDFDPKKHICRKHVSEKFDRNALPVTSFHLPSMKCSPLLGEDVYWAAQDGPSDPKAALQNHLLVNAADDSAPLFAWKHPKGICPLTRKELLKRLASISAITSAPDLKGHSIRIGGTLDVGFRLSLHLVRFIPLYSALG